MTSVYGRGAAEWRTTIPESDLAVWEGSGSAQAAVCAMGRAFALQGKGCLPGGVGGKGAIQQGWLGSQQGAPTGAAAPRGGLGGARGQQDALRPEAARVRVCALGGGARRVHGTGGTRATTGARRRGKQDQRRRVKTLHKTRIGQGTAERWRWEPSRRAGPTLRPAVQHANTEPLHQQTEKDAARLSLHPGRGTSPQDRHARRHAERAPDRTLARSSRDLGNHSAGGY